VLGKTAGKDAVQGKLTYPSLIGMEKSKALLSQLTSEAVAILDPLSGRAKKLRLLAQMLNKREK
jgi:geranylgeranyl pyrophosphate synthase